MDGVLKCAQPEKEIENDRIAKLAGPGNEREWEKAERIEEEVKLKLLLQY